jgi:hypothetical protein
MNKVRYPLNLASSLFDHHYFQQMQLVNPVTNQHKPVGLETLPYIALYKSHEPLNPCVSCPQMQLVHPETNQHKASWSWYFSL